MRAPPDFGARLIKLGLMRFPLKDLQGKRLPARAQLARNVMPIVMVSCLGNLPRQLYNPLFVTAAGCHAVAPCLPLSMGLAGPTVKFQTERVPGFSICQEGRQLSGSGTVSI
jgi:hypothetical protein